MFYSLALALAGVVLLAGKGYAGEYCGNGPLLPHDAYILGASWGEASEVGRQDRHLPRAE